MPVPPFSSVLRSGVYVRCIRWLHDNGNFTQASIIHQATITLGYRSRTLLQASPRALTSTQAYTPRLGVRGGASGLRMLDGLEHRFAHFFMKNLMSIRGGQYEEVAELSTHTTNSSASFTV